MADWRRDDIGTAAAGADWSRPAHTPVTIRSVARASIVRRIPCMLGVAESGGARSRAAGNPTGGI
jgi:hypothetical protein